MPRKSYNDRATGTTSITRVLASNEVNKMTNDYLSAARTINRGTNSCQLIYISRATLMLFTIIALVGCGTKTNPFTGSFIANSTSRGSLLYLTITQTNGQVAGNLLLVTKDENGATKQEALPITGNANGVDVTLTAKRIWPFADLSFHGHNIGSNIEVTAPEQTNGLLTFLFVPGSAEQFNDILRQWQTNLAKDFAKQQAILAKEQALLVEENAQRQAIEKAKSEEARDIIDLSVKLSEALNVLKETGIPSNIGELKAHVDEEQVALQTMNQHFAKLRNDASINSMSCYQAYEVVGYDFTQTLGYDFNQSLPYANRNYAATKTELETRLINSDRAIANSRGATKNLAEAMRSAKFAIPPLTTKPEEATSVINAYESIVKDAQQELVRLRGVNKQIIDDAQKIMRDGQQVTMQAQARAGRCTR